MTKEELWKAYTSRNPSFAGDGNVTMSAAGLKKLFDQTWEFAQSHGYVNGKAFAEMKSEMKRDASSGGFKNPFNVFDEMFGR